MLLSKEVHWLACSLAEEKRKLRVAQKIDARPGVHFSNSGPKKLFCMHKIHYQRLTFDSFESKYIVTQTPILKKKMLRPLFLKVVLILDAIRSVG